MQQLKYSLLLFLAALIWGLAFVAQQDGMNYLGPLAFNGIRWLIGSLTLFLFLLMRQAKGARLSLKAGWQNTAAQLFPENPGVRRLLLTAGLLCGLATALASNLQQWGILLANNIGKAGFITACYVVLVPLFAIFLGKRPGGRILFCAVFSMVGFYLLSVREGFSVSTGDIILLGGAIGYAIQILFIDHFSPHCDNIALAFWEFLFCGLVSTGIGLIAEHPTLSGVFSAWLPILYAGVFSCGIAFTLQIVAQAKVDPTVASLIMCLESVISAIAGALILRQYLTGRQLAGCAVVLLCVVLIQLPKKETNA